MVGAPAVPTAAATEPEGDDEATDDGAVSGGRCSPEGAAGAADSTTDGETATGEEGVTGGDAATGEE